MKIAYILRGPGISGGQRVVHEHAQRLHARSHEAGIHFLDGARNFWLVHDYPLVSAEFVTGADIVVATSWPTAYAVAEWQTAARKFYLVQGREAMFLDMSQVKQMSEAEWTYRLPFEIVTIAPWLQRMLKEEYGRDVAFVPNGVNETFNPDVEPEPRERKRVLLVEGSAHSMAKDVFGFSRRVVETLPDELRAETEVWCFTWDERFRDLWADGADRMFFRPEQDAIRRMYAGADVLLKCSRFEGAPCPVVEAMASGCVPVVTLEHNGDYYYGAGDVQDGVTGFLSHYGALEPAVANLTTALTDDGKRAEMRAAGLAYVKDALNWDLAVDRLEGIYMAALVGAGQWQRAQVAEAEWWVEYIKGELGNPPFSVFLGQRRQQLKDALRRFGHWRDQNYGVVPGGRWLDAGSGPVSMLHGLGQADVLAVDPLMKEYAAQLATVCGLGQRDNVTYEAAPIEAVTANGFRGVWCWNVLDHTADWQAALGNMVDVLSAGGELWLMTHCRPANRLDAHHVQSYAPADVLAFLTERGLRLEFVDVTEQVGTKLDELYVRAVKA